MYCFSLGLDCLLLVVLFIKAISVQRIDLARMSYRYALKLLSQQKVSCLQPQSTANYIPPFD